MIDATQPQVLVAEFEAVSPMKSVIARAEFEALDDKVNEEIARAKETERVLEELIKDVDVVDLGRIAYKELEGVTKNGVYRGVIVPSDGFTLKEQIFDVFNGLYFSYLESYDAPLNSLLGTTGVRAAICDNYYYNSEERYFLVAGVKDSKVVYIGRGEYHMGLPQAGSLVHLLPYGLELQIDSWDNMYEAFVLTVINNNAVADELGKKRSISQELFGIKFSLDGKSRHAKAETMVRVAAADSECVDWGGWKRVGDYTLPQATVNSLGGVMLTKSIDDSEKVPTSQTIKTELDKKQAITNVVWSNDSAPLSDMNDFTTAGVYNITGEHTRNNDNLPIANTGDGHTFSARLLVLDSSISGTGIDTDKCITQVLSFSNRVGGDGNVYIRTARGASLDSLSWEKWATLQTNVNVGVVSSLDSFIDNGIYSGVYSYGGSFAETFVMVVINDYAVAGERHRSVAQFKYAFDTYKAITTFKHRILREGSTIDWTDWEDIGGKYVLPTATSNVLGGVKVYQEKGKVSSGPSGAEYSVNIRPNGQLYTTVNHADATNEGVIKVSNVVGEYIDTNPLGNRYGVNVGNDGVASVTIPYAEEHTEGLVSKVHSLDTDNDDAVPTAKAVKDALDNIPQGGGGSVDLSDYYTKEEIDNKPFVTTEPTTEELPDVPEYITRTDLDNAIAEAITITINTPV